MAERKGIRQMFFDGEWSKLRWWESGPLIFAYVIWFAVRGLARAHGTVLTASLAFATALSVVPLLSVALWVLLSVGNVGDGAALEPYIQQLFPAAAGGIVTYLTEFAQTSASEVAGIGAITFFGIAFFLFVAIERAFNIIWSSHRKRPIARKLGAFTAIMTIGPVFLSLSFGLTTYAAIRAEQFNVDPGAMYVLLPFVLAFAVFTAMNHFLPTARVQPIASVLAGAFTAAAFELGKTGFNLYVTELVLVPYNQIYGALGLFPLFLVWLYVIWIIVLFGASLAYTAQNLRTLIRVERAAEHRPGRAGDHIYSPTIGLELYTPIARAFKSGEGRLSDRDLVAITGYPESVVRAAVHELERIGALEIVDQDEGDRRLLPAKQLEDIELWPMLEAFIDFDRECEARPVDDLIRRYKAASLEVLGGENALALVPAELRRAAPAKQQPVTKRAARPAPAVAEPSTPAVVVSPDDVDVRSPIAEPVVDADLFDAPPDHSFAEGDAEGPTLDAQLRQARAIADRARNLSTARKPDGGQTAATGWPVSPADSTVDEPTAVERSDDGIRIHTQDILIEEEEVITPTLSEPSARQMLREAMNSRSGKKKRTSKEPSIEIDIAGMWDDFEVDNYDEMLAQASSEVQRSDPHVDEAAEPELGGDTSSPPPMPGDNK